MVLRTKKKARKLYSNIEFVFQESEQTLKETESTVTIQGECDLMTTNRDYSYMNYCKYSKE